jgi:high-affinity nickel-transport protein
LIQIPLLGTALILGLRHGIDLDHIAALVDICGASAGEPRLRRKGLTLSLAYALGHALVISVLGLAAITFAALLPAWIDTFMERVVGVTLVVLGFYLLNTVFGAIKNADTFKFKSRWTAFYSFLRGAFAKLTKQAVNEEEPVLSARGTFAIGMLHGIGAETATQVLLISAVGGVASQSTAIAMLAAFVIGLVASNTGIALLSLGGFGTASSWRPLYLLGGGLAGAFSLFVGGTFLLGLVE